MSTIESNKKDFSAKGTISNPYTEEEYQQLQAEGKDIACYVEGRGFCAPAAMAPPPNPGSPSDSSDPSISQEFFSAHLLAGEFKTRPIELPVEVEVLLSWDTGDFDSFHSPNISAQFVSDNGSYRDCLRHSSLSIRWVYTYYAEFSGRFCTVPPEIDGANPDGSYVDIVPTGFHIPEPFRENHEIVPSNT